jgi:hypothetical protein
MLPHGYEGVRELSKRLVNNSGWSASFTLNDSLTAPTSEQRGREVSWQPSALLAIDIASLVSLRDDTVQIIRQRVAQLASIKTVVDIRLPAKV